MSSATPTISAHAWFEPATMTRRPVASRPGKYPAGKGLIDDGHAGAPVAVASIEGAPLTDGNPHRVEEAGAHQGAIGRQRAGRVAGRLSLEPGPRAALHAGQRQELDRARRRHAREGVYPFEDPVEERDALRGGPIAEEQPHRERAGGVEAGIHLGECREAVQQEAGTDEQHDR